MYQLMQIEQLRSAVIITVFWHITHLPHVKLRFQPLCSTRTKFQRTSLLCHLLDFGQISISKNDFQLKIYFPLKLIKTLSTQPQNRTNKKQLSKESMNLEAIEIKYIEYCHIIY